MEKIKDARNDMSKAVRSYAIVRTWGSSGFALSALPLLDDPPIGCVVLRSPARLEKGPRVKRLQTALRRVKGRARGSLGRSWREYCRHLPIVRRKVFLETYGGNGLTCSPEAIFRYLSAHHGTEGFTYVWVVQDETLFAEQIAELRRYAPFTVVRRGSRSYYRHLYTSEFLVNNMSFAADFIKREDQTYLNTWHGTPLKKMGYDVSGRVEDGRNIIRNFLMADYLLSGSESMTERMYLGAFKLTNVFEGTLLQEGSPRTDLQHDGDRARRELARRHPALGFEEDSRKVVLYAPTWRGSDYQSPEVAAELVHRAVETIESTLDPTEYRVLVKPHQAVARAFATEALSHRVHSVPAGLNPNLLLAVTDVLVTDYSSIFFDFLATDRPVIHYVPDLEDFEGYRDVYEQPSHWPGIVAADEVALRQSLVEATTAGWKPAERYRTWAQNWAPHEDGNVSRRVVDAVFFGRKSRRAIVKPSDGRTKIVIYIGPLIRNGITSAAMNLLRNIDYDQYDVTALVPYTKGDEHRREQWNRLDPRVRVMFRFGQFTGSAVANLKRTLRFNIGGIQLGKASASRKALWRQEWHRIFGAAQFDHLIDFTGYSPFWGALFIGAVRGNRVIWQHNDLAADAKRTVDGQRHLYNGLTKVFSLYPWFNKIVSVSEPLMQINRESLSTPETWDRFDWVPNTLDAGSLLAAMRQSESPEPPAGDYTFINVGRLSPEKNQSRLLRAFQKVSFKYPQVRLKLLGDGPLRERLEAEAMELNIAHRVEFSGLVPNPYPAMKRADCMVVSSDYEGQPMVILEAMSLGLPVITTAFGSVKGAFPLGSGTIVDPSVQALSEAMISSVESREVKKRLDPEEYNRQTVRRFEHVLGVGQAPVLPETGSTGDNQKPGAYSAGDPG